MPEGLSTEDRLAIAEIVARYARAADTSDVEAFVGLFTTDGVLELPKGRHQGRGAIQEFIEGWRSGQTQRPPRQHHGDGLVIDGDAGACSASFYTYTIEQQSDGRIAIANMGLVMDQLVKRDGRWLIASRVVDHWGPGRVAPAPGQVSQ